MTEKKKRKNAVNNYDLYFYFTIYFRNNENIILRYIKKNNYLFINY